MLRSWNVSIRIEPADKVPVYLQVARALAGEIQRGRLPAGSPLPGTRALSRLLGLHRNTITAAYEELTAQGWAISEPSRGTFVARDLPLHKFDESRENNQKTPSLTLAPIPPLEFNHAQKILSFTDGTADARLAPIVELSVAFRRAIKKQTASGWSYTDPRGSLHLRAQVADMLRTRRAVMTTEDQIIITRGSQMALYLAAHALLSPASAIAVEQLGYRKAWDAFRTTGAQVIGVPMDEQGISVTALEQLSSKSAIRAVYVTPYHQYPTTVTLSAPRRLELLHWAEKTGAVVIEDDYDNEFQYEGVPILPLASTNSSASVLYIGTFSKMFAPGLRIGFIVATGAVLKRMLEIRTAIDRQGDSVLESAVAELMRDGELQRSVRKACLHYRERRDCFAGFLKENFGEEIRFSVPTGGMALWVQPTSSIDTARWAELARRQSISIAPSSEYALDGSNRDGIRLGFASLNVDELCDGAQRLSVSFMATKRN